MSRVQDSPYLEVRRLEGRLYSDRQVARLPVIAPDHPLSREWRARSVSARRLTAYLKRKGARRILDVGCGNGWMSATLARQCGAFVVGADINLPELVQACRVFKEGSARFAAADVLRAPFPPRTFDSVVIASAAQYFEDLPDLLEALRPLLASGGEVHILDTPFYGDAELDAAKARTADYYRELGKPDMTEHYFHHTWSELDGFDARLLHDPRSLRARFSRRLGLVGSPFPWLRVRVAP